LVHQAPATPQKKIKTLDGATLMAVLAAKALRQSAGPSTHGGENWNQV